MTRRMSINGSLLTSEFNYFYNYLFSFLQVAVIVMEIDSVDFTCPVRQLQQKTIMGLDALVTNMINFTKAEL